MTGGSSATEHRLIPAATVILGRDSSEGLEVLMLKRNSKIAFGGAWVFPGGRVDDADHGESVAERARAAAIRESVEETGLVVASEQMKVWSYWSPPPAAEMLESKGAKRRFSTFFFIAPAPSGGVTVDMGEIHDHRWLKPADALELHRTEEIELIPPTWVSLCQLLSYRSIGDAVRAAAAVPHEFITRPIPGKPIVLTWSGDVAYDDPTLVAAPGSRNRLTMNKGNWVYDRS